jgi:hypothetical protein
MGCSAQESAGNDIAGGVNDIVVEGFVLAYDVCERSQYKQCEYRKAYLSPLGSSFELTCEGVLGTMQNGVTDYDETAVTETCGENECSKAEKNTNCLW